LASLRSKIPELACQYLYEPPFLLFYLCKKAEFSAWSLEIASSGLNLSSRLIEFSQKWCNAQSS